MTEIRIPATFMRGGTSKGVMFSAADLPADAGERDSLFLRAMGSPDPYGRQLNGMGGGISSLSKVCVVGPPSRGDADVDYLFGQVLVSEPRVDYGGNCGNMSAAVGPFALAASLVPPPPDDVAAVRIHNVNTGKIIRAAFPVRNGRAWLEGNAEIDGVAGRSAAIRLDFLDPAGSKTAGLLPAGEARTALQWEGRAVEASLVDAGNPCVFVEARALGLAGTETPDAIESMPHVMAALESLRRQASVRMGLASNEPEAAKRGSVPKVALVFAPVAHRTGDGRTVETEAMDLGVRMISMEKPHRAVPVTGAVCLGAAIRLPGTVPHALARASEGALRIAHPSGLALVDACFEGQPPRLVHASLVRTARFLFEGHIFC